MADNRFRAFETDELHILEDSLNDFICHFLFGSRKSSTRPNVVEEAHALMDEVYTALEERVDPDNPFMWHERQEDMGCDYD